MKCIAVAAFLAVSSLTPADAEELTGKSYAACMGKAGGATFAMQDCIGAELALQDKRLNTAYSALMTSKSLIEKRKAQLRDVQRKWIVFRDANCAFYADPAGGQSARLAANECVLTQTAQRAAELEGLTQE